MATNSIENKVESKLKPIIENLNYELYDVQYVKEGKDYYLRIIIDFAKFVFKIFFIFSCMASS